MQGGQGGGGHAGHGSRVAEGQGCGYTAKSTKNKEVRLLCKDLERVLSLTSGLEQLPIL